MELPSVGALTAHPEGFTLYGPPQGIRHMTVKAEPLDRELFAITTLYLCASTIQLGLALWNLVTENVRPGILVGGSLILCLAAVANYAAHVRKTYRTCLESRGAAAASPYELKHFQNGLLGVRKPSAGSFFARAAWRAGRAVAAGDTK
jgi:hypothetical protein